MSKIEKNVVKAVGFSSKTTRIMSSARLDSQRVNNKTGSNGYLTFGKRSNSK